MEYLTTLSKGMRQRRVRSHTNPQTSQTFRELRDTAEAQGIEGWSKLRKNELVAALEAQK